MYEAGIQYDIDPVWIKDTFGIEVTGKKNFEVQAPADGDGNKAGDFAFFP